MTRQLIMTAATLIFVYILNSWYSVSVHRVLPLCPIVLGDAASFVLFSGAGTINNNENSVLTGNVGVTSGSVNGFPPGIINGRIITNSTLLNRAKSDIVSAKASIDSLTCGATLLNNMASATLTPNVYCATQGVTITGTITLDALDNPDAIFIFKIANGLSLQSNAKVLTTKSGRPCNVFWSIGQQINTNPGSSFIGTAIAKGHNNIVATSVIGRIFSTNGGISTQRMTGAICSTSTCSVQGIVPMVNCVLRHNNGTCTSHWGYKNLNSDTVSIPIGPLNSFSHGIVNRGQPTAFLSGTHNRVFSVSTDCSMGNITWTIVTDQ